jgi:hypothetical protein
MLMSRPPIIVMLIALSTILLSSHWATAFTLRFGTVAGATPTKPGSEDSDIPTPQLFRVAIDPSGATLGIISPTDGYGAPEPALQLQKPTVVTVTERAVATQQASQQVEKSITAHRLSGAELLLLRKTSVVADRRPD